LEVIPIERYRRRGYGAQGGPERLLDDLLTQITVGEIGDHEDICQE